MPIQPTNTPNNPSGEPTLEEKFARLEKEHQALQHSSTVASTLLSDPAVRTVLTAKQRGEEVQVMTKEQLDKLQKAPADPQPAPVNLNDLDDNEALASEMMKRFSDSLDSVLATKLDPLLRRVQQTEGIAAQTMAEKIDHPVHAVKKKYIDVEDFEPDMITIAKGAPNLSVEELYVLAKARKNSPIVPASGLSSEKPSRENPARSIRPVSEVKGPRGRAGFVEILRKAQGRE